MNKAVEKIHAYLPGQFVAGEMAIRFRATPELSEPVMRVCILAPVQADRPIRRALVWRSVPLVGRSFRGMRRVFYATAPLSKLLGLERELKEIAGDDVDVTMTLGHYAPLEVVQHGSSTRSK
ncbi:hypothetical protein M0534_01860 [Methylonatrum kenyense]|uniref:hypothetical protein n=1 Tax=Methylonatrum kenyense TaxID=455253 RepID=UPI0020BFC4F4|nr:hypothetical protein [Methylonatrum kenyense]MCK8515078.1 hypothetical protein [Methylonatrum kenyense]